MRAHVPELITLASDPNVEITKLLRMAKVVARLLQQTEAIIWLDHELQGYPDGCTVPCYRQRRGNLAYWQAGSHHLLSVANTERAVQWQTCPLSLPASELAELAATGKALRVRYPPELMSLLMAEIGTEREVEICMPTVQVRALIAAVQERVLDWALTLAASGVQGDSMSVTPQERQQAQQMAPVSIHIGGNATGVQIQLNSPGGHQQQIVSGEQKTDALIFLLAWLQQVNAEGTLSASAHADLQAKHAALQAQANAPTPSWPLIGTLANSVRAILEGAGGVLSAQALGWLAILTGS